MLTFSVIFGDEILKKVSVTDRKYLLVLFISLTEIKRALRVSADGNFLMTQAQVFMLFQSCVNNREFLQRYWNLVTNNGFTSAVPSGQLSRRTVGNVPDGQLLGGSG